MLQKIDNNRNSHQGLSEYGRAFIDFLVDKNLTGIENISEIIDVCKKIESDFTGKIRTTGDFYTSHLYETTRLYIELHGEKISQKRIITCLLHDNIEDIDDDDYDSIKNTYGEQVAFGVHLLSKRKVRKGETKQERNKKYFENFKSISSLMSHIKKEAKSKGIKISNNQVKKLAYQTAAIKICDRIHNLLTMPEEHFSIEKCERKIQETEDYLIPLSLELGREHEDLVDALRKATVRLTRLQHKIKAQKSLSKE